MVFKKNFMFFRNFLYKFSKNKQFNFSKFFSQGFQKISQVIFGEKPILEKNLNFSREKTQTNNQDKIRK